MNTEKILEGLTNFSTAPDAIFAACGISLILAISYCLIRLLVTTFSKNKNSHEKDLPRHSNGKLKGNVRLISIEGAAFAIMVMGATEYSAADMRYAVLGDVFGTVVQGYHVAGLLLSMAVLFAVFVVIRDIRKKLVK